MLLYVVVCCCDDYTCMTHTERERVLAHAQLYVIINYINIDKPKYLHDIASSPYSPPAR